MSSKEKKFAKIATIVSTLILIAILIYGLEKAEKTTYAYDEQFQETSSTAVKN